MQFTTATLLAALTVAVSAKNGRTFAVNHFYGNGPLTQGRMDPIVSPGVASGHHHTIQGGSNFALTMTDTQLLSSSCTSSRIKNDKSNYWTPSLFFQDPKDGSFTPVPLFYMNVYYFFEGTDDKIEAFPEGLRMVVGNPSLRTPPSFSGINTNTANGPIQPVQWTCPRSGSSPPTYPPGSDGMHGAGIVDPNGKDRGVGFPDVNCDGYASPLRADLHFPSCYNPAVGIHDYKNNMVFPSSAGTSSAGKENCPPGYIHVPHLFYEVYWNTPLFADRWTPGQSKQPFVLSNGDPTGYSLHGDFLNGWDTATLQQIIDNCDAGDSGMDKCPGLIGGLSDDSKSCNIPAAITDNFVINSKLTTKLNALPGNNPVTGFGSTPAPPPSNPGNSPNGGSSTTKTAAAPTSSASPAQSPSTSSGAPKKPIVPSTPITTADATNPTPDPYGSPATTSTAPASTETADLVNGTTSAAPDIAGWSSQGCYADKLGVGRVMSGIKFASVGKVSTSGCVAYCDKKGYTMAGTEYGGQCFCANSLSESNLLSDSMCDMKCEGDATEICGGHLSLTVYKKANGARRRRGLDVHAAHRRLMHMPRSFKA